ncbi:RNA-directed DNA polymerase, eukaryota, reverse transcriptase zinc-binding domain protein [Tanacetum coccineum]
MNGIVDFDGETDLVYIKGVKDKVENRNEATNSEEDVLKAVSEGVDEVECIVKGKDQGLNETIIKKEKCNSSFEVTDVGETSNNKHKEDLRCDHDLNMSNKSYADVTEKNIINFNKKLLEIPTELDSNGNEIVVFDDVMIAKGRKGGVDMICNVPLKAWKIKGISALATKVGKPFLMDNVTVLCVEWELAELVLPDTMQYGRNKELLKTKQRQAQMFSKGEEENYGSNSDRVEMKDVYLHDTSMAKCMEKDVLETHIKPKRLDKVRNSIFGIWEWCSNMKFCDKGCRIMIGWNSDNVSINLIHSAKRYIFYEITTTKESKRVFCTFVYVANRGIKRRKLWKDLQIQNRVVGDKAWIIMGDMNVTLVPNEHSAGGSIMTSDMNEFKEIINSIEMEHIARSGLFFTWTKNLFNTKAGNTTDVLKKLDRVMGNENFIDKFSQAHAIFLLYLIFDHCPSVTILPNAIKINKRSFKFANLIADKQDFLLTVRNNWTNEYEGC